MTRPVRPFIAIALPLTLAACGAAADRPLETNQPATDVQVADVRRLDVPRYLDAGGVIEARATALVAARILADVDGVLVNPGDRVRRGQPLVRLDDRDLRVSRERAAAARSVATHGRESATAALTAATSAMTLAQITYDRIAQLHDRRAATTQELDEAQAARDAARAQAAAAEARVAEAQSGIEAARAVAAQADVALSWTVIRAPFDAIVSEKLTEPGHQVGPGTALLRLEDARYRAAVTVDASRAAGLTIGQPVQVEIGGTGAVAVLTGTITELARAAGVLSQALVVRADLPEHASLRSGQFARVRVQDGVRTALVVPETSLQRHGQLTQVFVAGSDGRARLRLVSIGPSLDGLVEVLAGLDEGERVVVDPPAQMRDGTPMRIVAGALFGEPR